MGVKTKTIKLKNKRIVLGRVDSSGDLLIKFIKLINEDEKNKDEKRFSESIIIGNKVETSVLISKAAAVSLFYLLKSELGISDLKEFETESNQKVF